MFVGEPQSVLVDARTQTQILQGLMPDTRYEVTVVSVRGFEESEPLTGFLTTGNKDCPNTRRGRERKQGCGGGEEGCKGKPGARPPLSEEAVELGELRVGTVAGYL